MSCQCNGQSLFLPCGKKPECPEKRTSASLLGLTNRNKPLEAGGVHCIISLTKFTQEPQRMRHRIRLFSARTPNVAHAWKKTHPLKKKSPKIDCMQIKR